MDTQTSRIRAWVLIKSDDPKRLADQIWSHDDKKEGRIVIVRTDIVKGTKYNLVVPMDMHPDVKDTVFSFLEKYCGKGVFELLVVDCHIPEPAQNASGFITDVELSRGEKQVGVKAGRQDNSPGFNPWG
jgi:hypothetical protein